MAPSSSANSRPSTPGAPYMHTIPLPEENIETPDLQIHPLLDAAAEEQILYDFSLPLQQIITPDNPLYPLTDSQPATDPPVTALYISCRRISETFAVIVDETNFVSVQDVLRDIHVRLHGPADHIALSMHASSGAEEQLRKRCEAIEDVENSAIELQQGLRLVDLFDGAHVFGGLTRTEYDQDVWELHLQRLEE